VDSRQLHKRIEGLVVADTRSLSEPTMLKDPLAGDNVGARRMGHEVPR
jgi:hypothetical protein